MPEACARCGAPPGGDHRDECPRCPECRCHYGTTHYPNCGASGVYLADTPREKLAAGHRHVGRQWHLKLVRDNIPKVIRADGAEAGVAFVDPNTREYRGLLVRKLHEEATELGAAQAPSDFASEAADILEVLASLAEYYGVPWHEVDRVRRAKYAQRGGFLTGTILLWTEGTRL